MGSSATEKESLVCKDPTLHIKRTGKGTDGKAENKDWNYCPYCGVKIIGG
ncbi:hypothetical protein LCGC14_0758130 [marine sediment metagenome]|uniref:Uncharacterized protein n=1 Tax=marine sediment metagenome TaxID=412755 RepID=A0A0F9SM69_9ZZZZ